MNFVILDIQTDVFVFEKNLLLKFYVKVKLFTIIKQLLIRFI